MSLAALTTWVGLAGKAISNFSDDELESLAKAIAGDNSPSVLKILHTVRTAEPDTTAQTLLKSDTMKEVFTAFTSPKDTITNSVFCKCPVCEVSFEQQLLSA